MLALLDQDITLEDRFLAAFKHREAWSLNGSNDRLRRLHEEALGHFKTLGFPARKAEAWKYTPIGKVLRRDYTVLPGSEDADVGHDDIAPLRIPDLDAYVVVLINGSFSETLSDLDGLPDGVIVTGLAYAGHAYADLVNAHLGHYADYEHEVFTALNTAFSHDGVFVYVPRHRVVEKPVQVIHLVTASEDAFLQPRHLVIAEEQARLQLLHTESVRTTANVLVNAVTEMFVGAHAQVDRYEIQHDPASVSRVNTVQAYQHTGSICRNSTFTFGGEIIRNNIRALPDAETCETHMYGLFLGRASMHVDNHTIVDHAKPNCFSNELYKGVLDDRSTGVFNGRVLVRPDAQQINAYQSNKSILLSDTARMYSKPELEIYADDVKCSHGATTGQLDRDALFYLRARGLTEQQARALLLVAFARDVLENVAIEPLRTYLDTLVSTRFSDDG